MNRQTVVLPEEIGADGGVGLRSYQRAVRATDHLPPDELSTAILGLFGEVGSLLTVVKKQRRDATALAEYDSALYEELGDVLWYFTSLIDRAGLDLSVIAQRAFRGVADWDQVGEDEFGSWGDLQSLVLCPQDYSELMVRMSKLAGLVGELVAALTAKRFEGNRDRLSGELVAIMSALISIAEAADIDLEAAARANLCKIFSRYPLAFEYPPAFDVLMPAGERLPRQFELVLEEHRAEGRAWVTQALNGVQLGAPLTDNKAEADDYRFHDIFHVAYAVHLGWSPILRRLLRVKRKSNPLLDENEDGARAAITEEGVATAIFGQALDRGLFEGLERLDFDTLKLAHRLVRGFEAERCAYWQWERAILDGFRAFRALQTHRRGIIRADLDQHTMEFVLIQEGTDRVA